MNTPYAGEKLAATGYATLAAARRAIRTADQNFSRGATLEVRVRPNAEWARIGIDKDEFVLIIKETA